MKRLFLFLLCGLLLTLASPAMGSNVGLHPKNTATIGDIIITPQGEAIIETETSRVWERGYCEYDHTANGVDFYMYYSDYTVYGRDWQVVYNSYGNVVSRTLLTDWYFIREENHVAENRWCY